MRTMLTKTEDDWNACYNKARIIVQSNNTHFDYLKRIHSNPQKYAMWWLKQKRGNQNYKGSSPAEQNHSSVKLGKGSTLSLLERTRGNYCTVKSNITLKGQKNQMSCWLEAQATKNHPI